LRGGEGLLKKRVDSGKGKKENSLKGGRQMKKISFNMLIIFSIVAFIITPALATKPGETVNPNGFPSGPHYNLNIHGKKAEFTCPEQKYYLEVTECGCGLHQIGDLVEECNPLDTCEPTDIPIYGNSIFVPEDGQGIEIYMQSGKVGGKGKKAEALPLDELWAIDPCAGFDGDGAIIQLPPGEYDVYARALAKPTDNPNMTVTPELFAAEDENGNDLVYLGLVTKDGYQTPTTFTRFKGNPVAVPITGLFEWSGEVCYIEMPEGWSGTATTHCCRDYESDGIYDYCCYDENDDLIYQKEECSGDLSGFVVGECTEIETYCNEYVDPEWVFNIADFVSYLWDTDNNGLKLLQVRFYPRVAE
jgi:hypothetical protein